MQAACIRLADFVCPCPGTFKCHCRRLVLQVILFLLHCRRRTGCKTNCACSYLCVFLPLFFITSAAARMQLCLFVWIVLLSFPSTDAVEIHRSAAGIRYLLPMTPPAEGT